MDRVLVWDVPVRLYHWSLVAGVVGAFAIAELADDDGSVFVVHMLLGLAVGLMTILRILWGFIGSRYARFSGFEFRPAALIGYTRGLFAPPGEMAMGHNPATSYAALGMFASLLGLVLTGLVMSLGNREEIKDVHEVFAFGMMGIAGVHVTGVAVHWLRHRDGMVLSMLDGRKRGMPDAAIASRHLMAGLVGSAIILVAVVWFFASYDPTMGRATLLGTGLTLGGKEGDRDREQGTRKHHQKLRGEGEDVLHDRGDD